MLADSSSSSNNHKAIDWYPILLLVFLYIPGSADADSCSESKEGFFEFSNQPEPHCSTALSSSHQLSCSGHFILTDEKQRATVVWHVYLVDNDDDDSMAAKKNLASSMPVSENWPSVLTIQCLGETKSCSFRVGCQLVFRESSRHQPKSVRSRMVLINLGSSSCAAEPGSVTGRAAAILSPKPKLLVVSAAPLSQVTLPCLTVVEAPNDRFATSWYFNGSTSAIPDGDGVFNIDRRVQDEFLTWSNLTIFHVSRQHAGFYQCFGVDGFNIIRLEVTYDYEWQSTQQPSPSPSSVTITEASLQESWLQILFKFEDEPLSKTASGSDAPLIQHKEIAVGVVRLRNRTDPLGARRCFGDELGPGASTYFISAYVSKPTSSGLRAIGFDEAQLPDLFFIDRLICQQHISYFVFVKKLPLDGDVVSASKPLRLDYNGPADTMLASSGDGDVNSGQSLEIFDRKSGSSFVCLHSSSAIALLPENDNERLFDPSPMMTPLDGETIRAIPACNCLDCMTKSEEDDESSVTMPASQLLVPFAVGSLAPSTDYCVLIGPDCFGYQTQEGSLALSFERIFDEQAIAVSWQLPMCRNLGLGGSQPCQVTLKQLFLSPNEPHVELKQPVDQCAGRAIFKQLPNVNASHEVVITCGNADLMAKGIPAVVRILNVSLSVVSRSKLFLHWTTSDLGEEAPTFFQFYACPVGVHLQYKTSPIMDEAAYLSCLGCHHLKAATTTSLTPTSHFGEVTEFDRYADSVKILISVEVTSLTTGYPETSNLGILAEVTADFVNNTSDQFRPNVVSVVEYGGDVISWNVSWSFARGKQLMGGFQLHAFEVVATPVSSYLSGGDVSLIVVRTTTSSDRLFVSLANVSDFLFDRLTNIDNAPFIHDFLMEPFPKLPSCEFLVQVFPVWTPAAVASGERATSQQPTELTADFAGPPSSIYVHRSRLNDVLIKKYRKISNGHSLGFLNESPARKNQDASSPLMAPILATVAITLVVCLMFFVPYVYKK